MELRYVAIWCTANPTFKHL